MHLMLASMTCQDEVYAAMQDERGPDTINQSINQFTFCVLRTHQRSQQTMPMKILRMLSLNETSHSMLLWNAQKFRFCNQTTTSTCILYQQLQTCAYMCAALRCKTCSSPEWGVSTVCVLLTQCARACLLGRDKP